MIPLALRRSLTSWAINNTVVKIFLLGLPGSGKTTIGKDLATELGIQFVDLDTVIEAAEGISIPEMFSSKGESYFREVESRELGKWCDGADSFVMATGGGTPCFHDNLSVMKLTGFTIFLDVPVSIIAERLKNTPLGNRPMFVNVAPENIASHLETLRSRRISFYHLAHHTLSADDVSLQTLIELIKKGSQR